MTREIVESMEVYCSSLRQLRFGVVGGQEDYGVESKSVVIVCCELPFLGFAAFDHVSFAKVLSRFHRLCCKSA